MSFYTWIKNTSEYLLALAIFATVAGLVVAGLAYGLSGLAAGLTAGIVLWLTPWQRLFIAFVRWLSVWLFAPDTAPKRVRLAHERLPRRVRLGAPAHLLPYDRMKVRYGEHVAALLLFASGMVVLALACGVYFYNLPGGGEDALAGAFLTLMIGGYLLFALWRPDGQWEQGEDDWFYYFYDASHNMYQGNIHYTDHWHNDNPESVVVAVDTLPSGSLA